MPYEYRKMSAEDRLKVLQQRIDQKYPPHSPPHLARVAGCFTVSAACFEHAPILSSPKRRNEFEERILSEAKRIGFALDAWSILPNHYHLLGQIPEYERLPRFIHRLHNGTSFEWNKEDGCTGRRKVWFQYFDRLIENERHYYQVMNYIHYNPVKHGYCEDPYEWEWSSLRSYEESEGRDWLKETWRKYSPRNLNFEDLE